MLVLIHGDNSFKSQEQLQRVRSVNMDKDVIIVEGDTITSEKEIFSMSDSIGLFFKDVLIFPKNYF